MRKLNVNLAPASIIATPSLLVQRDSNGVAFGVNHASLGAAGAAGANIVADANGRMLAAGIPLAGITTQNFGELACNSNGLLSLAYAGGTVLISGILAVIGANTLALTASATNYVFVNASGTVTSNTTGFPVNAVIFPMAQVTTGPTAITLVTDKRPMLTASGPGGVTSITAGTGIAVTGTASVPIVSTSGPAISVNFNGVNQTGAVKIQSGTNGYTGSIASSYTITFPVAFSAVPNLNLQISANVNTATQNTITVASLTTTGFVAYLSGASYFCWNAIGT